MSNAVGFVFVLWLRLLGRLALLLPRPVVRRIAEEMLRLYGKLLEIGKV